MKVVSVALLLDEGSRFLLREGKLADLRARDASICGFVSRLHYWDARFRVTRGRPGI